MSFRSFLKIDFTYPNLRCLWSLDQTRCGFLEYGEEVLRPSLLSDWSKKDDNLLKTEVIKVMPLTSEEKRSGKQRWRYRAVVAVGNCRGQLGFGSAVLNTRQKAMDKATCIAQTNQFQVKLGRYSSSVLMEHTINNTKTGCYKEIEVQLIPAPPDSGIKGSPMARVILQLAGVQDCVVKTKNIHDSASFAFALFAALR